ncbi:RteC domain-containing protein [Chryseobacterium chendengshani]|uniref:RteC domain-containing protein n=1 Tax=Chryseobacterium sp. LJ668 TaxID=2864040 RepID=UPI001C690B67|nr:RteC domain-containing protein [Chryseobacterium sp. LJ668]MBW8523815.1 RteC domain-containing protein [Chryseobacterium sp. LJ668]QYK16758.1 RteC domain-containing protein [Chryseobacterium sp. LJ668]
MVNKTIFRKAQHLYARLTDDLELIEFEHSDLVRISELSLWKIDESIINLKALIIPHEFESAADEIHFFKEIKPLFISQFIFHSQIIQILTYQPAAGEKAQRSYFAKEIDKLTIYYQDHAEFYSYHRREATYLDHKYFVRKRYDLKMNLPSGLYDYDENFTTSHDHHISQIKANQKLDEFLKLQIEKIQNKDTVNSLNSPLVWSESKVALVEVVYGLYKLNCFNGGNIELSEVIKFVEKSLDINLGNYHKTIFEIRNRKTGSTKFLQMVNDNLNQHFRNTEGE